MTTCDWCPLPATGQATYLREPDKRFPSCGQAGHGIWFRPDPQPVLVDAITPQMVGSVVATLLSMPHEQLEVSVEAALRKEFT